MNGSRYEPQPSGSVPGLSGNQSLGSLADARGSLRSVRGMTLLEVLIALFIFMVGIVGVLAAMPVGVNSAQWVVFQDASIHLAHSKLAEFRRDRVDPPADLIDGSAYMDGGLARHEPLNGAPGGWRDFAGGRHLAFSRDNFDDLDRYEWKVEVFPVYAQPGAAPVPPGRFVPDHTGGSDVKLSRVVVTVHYKGTPREFSFSQYMFSYER